MKLDERTSVVKINEAKTNLSALIARVEEGEQFTIHRGRKPVAMLVPIPRESVRELGFLDLGDSVDGILDPMTDAEIDEWY